MPLVDLSIDVPEKLLMGDPAEMKTFIMSSLKQRLEGGEIPAPKLTAVALAKLGSGPCSSRNRSSESLNSDDFELISNSSKSPKRPGSLSPAYEMVKCMRLSYKPPGAEMVSETAPSARNASMSPIHVSPSPETIEEIIKQEVRAALKAFKVEAQSAIKEGYRDLWGRLNEFQKEVYDESVEEVKRLRKKIKSMDKDVTDQLEGFKVAMLDLTRKTDENQNSLLDALFTGNDQIAELRKEVAMIAERVKQEELPKKVADHLVCNDNFQNILLLADDFKKMMIHKDEKKKDTVEQGNKQMVAAAGRTISLSPWPVLGDSDLNTTEDSTLLLLEDKTIEPKKVPQPLAEAPKRKTPSAQVKKAMESVLQEVANHTGPLSMAQRAMLTSIKDCFTPEELGDTYKTLIELLMRATDRTVYSNFLTTIEPAQLNEIGETKFNVTAQGFSKDYNGTIERNPESDQAIETDDVSVSPTVRSNGRVVRPFTADEWKEFRERHKGGLQALMAKNKEEWRQIYAERRQQDLDAARNAKSPPPQKVTDVKHDMTSYEMRKLLAARKGTKSNEVDEYLKELDRKKKTMSDLREIVAREKMQRAFLLDYSNMELDDLMEIFKYVYDRIVTTEHDMDPVLCAYLVKIALDANISWPSGKKTEFFEFVKEKLRVHFEKRSENFTLCKERIINDNVKYEKEFKQFLTLMKFIGEMYNEKLLGLPFIKWCILTLHITIPNVGLYAINPINEDAILSCMILIQTIHQNLSLEDTDYLFTVTAAMDSITSYCADLTIKEKLEAELQKTNELCLEDKLDQLEMEQVPLEEDQPGPSGISRDQPGPSGTSGNKAGEGAQ